MSSLHCPATILVARHGEAEYETEVCSALVVSHGGAILATIPQLVGLSRTRGLGVALANCAVIELEKDADGWRLVAGLG